MSTNNFSGWSEKDLRRWLRENHPKPPTKDRWVQFTLHIRYVGCALELTIADDYEICIAELALGMRIMSASDPFLEALEHHRQGRETPQKEAEHASQSRSMAAQSTSADLSDEVLFCTSLHSEAKS